MMEAALPSLWASLYSWCSPTVLFLLLNLVIGTIAVTAARHSDPEDGADQRKLARAPSNIFGRLSSFKFAREAEGGGDQPKLARAPSALFGRFSSFKFAGEPEGGGDQPKLARAPSTLFGRLSSFKFAREPEDGPKPARAPSTILGRLGSFKFAREPYVDTPNATTEVVVSRNASQSQPPAEEVHFYRSQSDAQPTAGEVLPKLAAKLKKSASTKSAFAHFVESDIVPAAAVEAEMEEEEEEEVKEVDVQADAFINRFRKQLQLQRLDSLMRYKEMLNRGR